MALPFLHALRLAGQKEAAEVYAEALWQVVPLAIEAAKVVMEETAASTLIRSLVDKLDRVAFPDAKKSRILRFLHTYSHDGKISDPEHDLSVLTETPQVLTDLMELIKAEDARHFDEMMKVLNEAATER